MAVTLEATVRSPVQQGSVLCVFDYVASSSEANNIMNALKMIPSVQPVRSSGKTSVKRNQTVDSHSSQSSKKQNGKKQYPGGNNVLHVWLPS